MSTIALPLLPFPLSPLSPPPLFQEVAEDEAAPGWCRLKRLARGKDALLPPMEQLLQLRSAGEAAAVGISKGAEIEARCAGHGGSVKGAHWGGSSSSRPVDSLDALRGKGGYCLG